MGEGDLFTRTWTEATALADRWVTVAAIVPGTLWEAARDAFTALDPRGDRWRAQHLHTGITLMTPELAKGLEFDAVVLVEPARIVEEELARLPDAVHRADTSGPGARRASRARSSKGAGSGLERLIARVGETLSRWGRTPQRLSAAP
ncbi:MAG: hypothetical protein ACRDJL_03890 [Actinomycetota bacterium]